MLAGWLELEVTRTASGLGMVVDGSNNAIQEVANDGAAAQAGVLRGDLLVVVDGTRVTHFEGQEGPVEGTVMVTSEPESLMGAQHAIDPSRTAHTLTLLREIDPASVQWLEGQRSSMMPPQEQPVGMPPAPVASASTVASANPHDHYPWATDIVVPDATCGAGTGADRFKSKYNLPSGVALPPMQHIQSTHETTMRKTYLSQHPFAR